MFLVCCEHLFCLLDHLMLMNALYMQQHLQHQNTHYHVHCPSPDRTLFVQNSQRAPVFHLRHKILLQLRVGSQDLICISIAKWVRYYVCRIPLRPQHWWWPCQHCLLQCMLILLSNWNHFKHLEVWVHVLHRPQCLLLWVCKVCYFLQSIFVLMDTLVVMYRNLSLSGYVFDIQMIKYWLSTPSHEMFETDYMQYHHYHWQCHT